MSPATVTDTIEDLARRGFTDHFIVRGRKLVAIDAGRPFLPRDVVIREYHRFEGVSDPDDMAVVYALETREGTKGVLTDAYGAYSDPAVGAMLDILRIDPGPREPSRIVARHEGWHAPRASKPRPR